MVSLNDLKNKEDVIGIDGANELQEKFVDAIEEKDTMPYPQIDGNGKLEVIGDANKIKAPEKLYYLTLPLSKEEFTEEQAKGIAYDGQVKEFGDEYIVSIASTLQKVTASQREPFEFVIRDILKYFYEYDENNKIQFINDPEKQDYSLRALSQDKAAMLSLREAVGVILGFDKDITDKVLRNSLIVTMAEIMVDRPDLFAPIDSNLG